MWLCGCERCARLTRGCVLALLCALLCVRCLSFVIPVSLCFSYIIHAIMNNHHDECELLLRGTEAPV